jgi:hypothetical protein
MRPVTFNLFPEHEKREVARACAQYQHLETDFLIKGDRDEVLVWSVSSGKRRRYKAFDGPSWMTPFEDDLSEQYFRVPFLGSVNPSPSGEGMQ